MIQRDRLDRLMEQFTDAKPPFYDDYTNNSGGGSASDVSFVKASSGTQLPPWRFGSMTGLENLLVRSWWQRSSRLRFDQADIARVRGAAEVDVLTEITFI